MSPIDLANQLQSLVGQVYSPSSSLSSFETYSSKHAISDLCLKLLRTVQGPEEYTAILAESCQESSALNLITSLGVADLIASAPNEQLTLKELSEKTGAAEKYIGVALNLLLYHGYFIEIGQAGSQVYANNEFSNVLRSTPIGSGKSMKEAIGLAADDGARATNSIVAAASDSQRTACNLAFDTSVPLFVWLNSPGNEWRGQRTAKAMVQLHGMSNGDVPHDYPWESLTSPLIDIGGGIGSLEVMLLTGAEKNRNLDFIIFDIAQTIEGAKKSWSARPQWMQDKVSFVAGDFMQPDPDDSKIPVKAGTYIIRHVLHDWDDDQVVQIITHVVNAIKALDEPSRKKTKLLLVEMLFTPTSSRFVRTTSMQLLTLSGGYTRTLAHLTRLVEQVDGLNVEKVSHVRGVDLIIELSV